MTIIISSCYVLTCCVIVPVLLQYLQTAQLLLSHLELASTEALQVSVRGLCEDYVFIITQLGLK